MIKSLQKLWPQDKVNCVAAFGDMNFQTEEFRVLFA